MHLPRLAALPVLALALCSASSFAQTTRLPVVQHRVQAGDTLEQLARRYLGDSTQWQALQQHNGGIDPYRLPPGQLLEIPLSLLRAATASVDYLQGSASLHREGSTAQPVQRGQPLQEGDALTLDPDAFVTVRLADGSTVRVQANSQVTLQQLRRRGRAGSLQTVLELEQGGMDIAVPGRPDATRQLEIRTPVAATSVRGTRFNVQVTEQGSSSAVDQGRVALQGSTDRASTLLQPGFGAAVDASGQASPPVQRLPAMAAHSLPSTVTDAQWLALSLPAVAQASAYQVQVSRDPAAEQVLRNGRFATPQVRFASLPDGDYWLHVQAQDAQGISGHRAHAPLRVKAHPVAPLAASPAPAAVVPQGAALLTCTPVHEAQAYWLQVAPLAPGQDPAQARFDQAVAQAEGPQCSLDVSALPAGVYAWRAASVRWVTGPHGAGRFGPERDQGPFGAVHSFSLQAPPAEPADIQTQSHRGHTTLYWAGGPGQRYRVQALSSAQASEPALDLWLDTPQWTVAGLPAGTWHIRLQAQDASGLLSSFSPTRLVTVLPLVTDGSGQTVGTGSGLGLLY